MQFLQRWRYLEKGFCCFSRREQMRNRWKREEARFLRMAVKEGCIWRLQFRPTPTHRGRRDSRPEILRSKVKSHGKEVVVASIFEIQKGIWWNWLPLGFGPSSRRMLLQIVNSRLTCPCQP